jgi:hypothetical protein
MVSSLASEKEVEKGPSLSSITMRKSQTQIFERKDLIWRIEFVVHWNLRQLYEEKGLVVSRSFFAPGEDQ